MLDIVYYSLKDFCRFTFLTNSDYRIYSTSLGAARSTDSQHLEKVLFAYFDSMQVLFLIASILLFSLNANAAEKKGDMSKYLKRTGAKFIEEMAQKPGIIVDRRVTIRLNCIVFNGKHRFCAT